MILLEKEYVQLMGLPSEKEKQDYLMQLAVEKGHLHKKSASSLATETA